MRSDILRTFDRQTFPARMVALWDAHVDSLTPVAESENFVYRFDDPAGNQRYLRLTHQTHRTVNQITSELDFVRYLAEHDELHVAQPVPSKSGNLIETIETPSGEIHAVAFEAVAGERIQWGTDAQNRKYLFDRGRMLGRL